MLWTMIKSRLRAFFRPRQPRGKALFWVALLSLLVGLIEFGEPLDVALRMQRANMFNEKASGKIVLVAVDQKSISEMGAWPWSRSNFAKTIEAVDRAGAEKIIVDHEFILKADAAEEAKLTNIARRVRNRIAIAHVQPDAESQNVKDRGTVNPELLRVVDQVSIDVWKEFLGFVWKLPYSIKSDGVVRPSLASALASRSGNDGEFFRIDYRIDPGSIPVYSAVDVVNGRIPNSALSGKRVVIASTVRNTNIFLDMPGSSGIPAVYVMIMGAETLMKGTPKYLSWPPLFLLALAVAYWALKTRKAKTRIYVSVAGLVGVIVIPFLTESFLIFLDVAPAIVLLTGSLIANTWSNFVKGRSHTNLVTGLPNFGALKERPKSQSNLVVAMIRNLPQIQLALSDNLQHAFMQRLVDRLSAINGGEKIYHTADGTFAWFADDSAENPLGHQMDGLYRVFQTPLSVNDQKIDINLSLGVDMRVDESIARRFDGAHIAAIESGENGARWLSFREDQHEDMTWRVTVLGELEQAISNGEIWVAYQPKVDANSLETSGAEALVRWTHPTKGDIRPDAFIPYAEENGRMSNLTAFVLEQALHDAASIKLEDGPLPIAVNMSARSLEDDQVVSLVSQLLDKYNFPADRLTLELTESAAIRDGRVSEELFNTLKGLGVRISIDDYGTGFSTLGYMKHIPSSEIKIDRSFVAALEKSHSDRLLVGSTIELAHSLGRTVVAEGVETEEAAEILRSLGCDNLQGYLTGAPCAIETFKSRYLSHQLQLAA